MKLPKSLLTTALLASISLITAVFVYTWTGSVIAFKTTLAASKPTPQATPTIVSPGGPPTFINIPKIGKNLPIKPATVHGNEWDMYTDAVAWLSTSAKPGEGNVILYAHDWTTLWADLYLLQPGDTIEVQQGELKRTYIVTQSKAVDQHDIPSILSDENRLTLYTCEGNFDQKRRVVYAQAVD